MDTELARILKLPAIEAAPLLIGAELTVRGVGGRLVEVEAYDDRDPASHCYGGPRGQNLPMFLPGGHIYVYRSYGVHWCMNLVTGPEGVGEAVLLRGLEPTLGIKQMRERREGVPDTKLAYGPGNLTKALGVTILENRQSLGGDVQLRIAPPNTKVVEARRVGITVAIDAKRRFFEEGNRYVTHRSRM
ncbi:MAG: DNA-3-methyladenine glycosylase [Armatimonadota bacterium]|nr:DNA-3-methyladenine glycosylase [Armatimonadota bacterium]